MKSSIPFFTKRIIEKITPFLKRRVKGKKKIKEEFDYVHESIWSMEFFGKSRRLEYEKLRQIKKDFYTFYDHAWTCFEMGEYLSELKKHHYYISGKEGLTREQIEKEYQERMSDMYLFSIETENMYILGGLPTFDKDFEKLKKDKDYKGLYNLLLQVREHHKNFIPRGDGMNTTRKIGEIGNYYGNLHTKKEDGKYFWSIENCDGHNWDEIPEYLFNALNKFEDEREK